MTPEFQSGLALAIVAGAAAGLLAAVLRKRRRPGCGGDCGCPSRPPRRR